MAATAAVVSFSVAVEAQPSVPDAANLIAGAPRVTTANHYADGSEQFFAGVWTSTRGSWRVRYTEHEFCHLLAGRVAIVGGAGERSEFGPGDSFVIPAGFVGTWEVLEDCRKLYAIYAPRTDR